MQQQLTGRVISAAVHEVSLAWIRDERHGNPYTSPKFWQEVADVVHSDGWATERIGVRCRVCGEAVLRSDSSAVLEADGSQAELCHECQKAARE